MAAALAGGDAGAALGLSLAQDTEGETVAAYIDGSSVKADGGNLSVLAASSPTITTTSVAVAIAAAFAGAGGAGAKSDLAIDTTTRAFVTGSTLTAAGNAVVVNATSTSTAAPTVASASAGSVAIAILISDATIAGTTEAYAGGNTTVSASDFKIQATGSNSATPTSTIVAGGAIGLGLAGAGSTATITQTTSAYIAAGANVNAPNTPVELTASTPTNLARSQVVSVATGGMNLAAVQNAANVGGTTSAYVAGTLTAGSLTALATTTSNTADANTVLTGVGGISASGLSDTAMTTAITSAYIAAGGQATLSQSGTDGPASFTATTATNQATAEATGVSIGVVSAQIVDVEANAGGTTDAYVAGGLKSSSLNLSATSTNIATPSTTTVAVGDGLVTVSKTVATISQATDARLKSGAKVTLSGAATFTATSTSTPTAHTTGVNVGEVSGAAEFVTTNLNGSTTAGADSGTSLHGTTLTATAHSTNSSPGHTDVSASFVGVSLLGGTGAALTSNVTQATDASLGGTIVLSGGANLNANSTTYSTATNDNVSVGGLSISVLNIAANLGGSTTAGVLAGGQLTASSLSATADGTDNASAITHFVGISVAGGSGSTTNAMLTQTTAAAIGGGATVNLGSGAASLTADSTGSAVATNTAISGGGVNVSAMNFSTSTQGMVGAVVGSGASVTAGSLDLSATGTQTATSSDSFVGVSGLGIGVVALNATDTTAVQASIGSNSIVQTQQSVTVDAMSNDAATANANGIQAGGIAVGATNATATLKPVVSAFIDAGAQVTSSHGAVTVEATEATTTGAQASGNITGVSIGTGEGAQIQAIAAGQVTSYIGGGATILAPGIVTVTAAGTNVADASAKTLSVGAVLNVAAIFATATASGVDSAYIGSNGAGATVGTTAQPAGGLVVAAAGADQSAANVNLSGGGAFSGEGGNATAYTKPTLNAYISGGSQVNTSGNVTVESTSTTEGHATTTGASGGIVDVSESLSSVYLTPTINTYIGSQTTIVAGGSITVESLHGGQPAQVSDGSFTPGQVSNNQITFAPLDHGLVTGATVTFAQNSNPAIGGLTDGGVYPVIVLSPTTLELGAAFNAATVNLANDTIVFPTADNLQDGDSLVYQNSGGTPIGGLTPGKTYLVRVIDSQTIKLVDPAQAFQTPTSFNPSTTISNDTIHLSGFSNGQAVTYRAPAPLVVVSQNISQSIINLGTDKNGNPIPDGYTSGEALVYSLAPGATAIGGLTPGTTYYVITVAANQFQLAAKPSGPGLTLNTSSTTGGQLFGVAGVQPIGGLVDGNTYYVINDTASGFQLAATPGGSALPLNATNSTGTHTLGVEGVAFTSAGSGVQDLVYPLTTNGASGTYRLVGAGGAGAMLNAPAGDGEASAGSIGSGGGFVQIGGASANVVSTPTVSTSVGNNVTLQAGDGDITVTSTSYANASADGTNSGGGFVAVGGGNAGVTTTNNNSATLGTGDTIVTPDNFTLQASSFHNVLASSDSSGGGAVSIASASTLTTTSDTASAQVGTSTKITAGGNILIQSSLGLVDTAIANSNGSGLGVNSDAEATTKGAAQATTTVQGGAILNAGGDLRILATQGTGGVSSAFATAKASAFGVHDSGNTSVTQVYNSDVVVGPSVTLSGPDQLQISADVGTPLDTAIGYGDSSAFGGVTDAGAINTVSTHAKVEVAASTPATTMKTGQLVVTANDPGPILITQAKRTTAFIDFGGGTSTPSQPVNEALIDFNANVTISGVELTIDSLGRIHTVPGITAQDKGSEIDVANITNPGSGTATVTASGGGSQNVSGTATFAYSAGVNIINQSSKNLVISNIDLSQSRRMPTSA